LGAPVVLELLQRCPRLLCLVTSRRRLNVAGERELVVAPLPTPRPSRDPDDLLRCESVQLFADRAQAVRSDFHVSAENADAVAEICSRLEGLPLALELAAAWAHLLTPRQMLPQLTHCLDFLVSSRRDGEERHRTLRAALDWSYRLLDPAA